MNIRMKSLESFMVGISVNYKGCLRPKIEQSRIAFIKTERGFHPVSKANGAFSHVMQKPMDAIKEAVDHELSFILNENRNGYGCPNKINGKTLKSIKVLFYFLEKNFNVEVYVEDIDDEFGYKYLEVLFEELDEYKIIKARG